MRNFIFLILLVTACQTKKYQYKIEGKKHTEIKRGDFFIGYKSNIDTLDAIAYTDTIFGYNSDSIWYYNTNGSITTLLTPYKVYRNN